MTCRLCQDYERILAAHSVLEGRHEALQSELEEAGMEYAQALTQQLQQDRTIQLLTQELKGLHVELDDYRVCYLGCCSAIQQPCAAVH